MSDKITLKSKENTNLGKVCVVTLNGQNSVSVCDGPFGNCQGWNIRCFNYIIGGLTNSKNIKSVIQQIKDVCYISKALLFVDLNRNYYDRIKEHVVFNTIAPYTSSNNSDMVFCIIDTRK